MRKLRIKAGIVCVAVASCVALAACSAAPSTSEVEEPAAAAAAQEAAPTADEDDAAAQDSPSPQEVEASNDEVAMRNVTLSTVPGGYYDEADHQGTLEAFAYNTRDYVGDGSAVVREATVYLPYGYDQNDAQTRYDILYLQHGAYGDERTWMYEYGDSFKNMIDHMIEDGSIPPLIIVMPYLPSGNSWYHDTTPIFYSEEIRGDLMPAVESHYHTYAQDVTDAGFAASRSHRAFGGFSAGSTTTWRVFLEGLDRFEYFMPMSGGLALGGDGSTCDDDAAALAQAATASGHGKREYFVFAATGTRDLAYQGLSAQVESMKGQTGAFDFTQTGFADGNLMYYTVDGNRHDYQYTYEYVYNGLRCLFSWETTL
ncbi:MAG: alpha/beta hydrolase-fold protein [Coriobacteriia bacterium]|nr:alpha/beta hydrolase-fold protein [Coriobacteriia bacterium]